MGVAVVEAGEDERAAQILSCPTQAGVHGVEIAAQDAGDLGRAQALELGEDEDLAPLGAQGVDRRGDPLESMAGVGGGLDGSNLAWLGQRCDSAMMSLERASPGRRDPPGDPAQPRTNRPLVPRAKPAMHDHEHVLGGILEVVRGNAERPQGSPHEREVLDVDRLELGRELSMVVNGHPILTISSSGAFCPGHEKNRRIRPKRASMLLQELRVAQEPRAIAWTEPVQPVEGRLTGSPLRKRRRSLHGELVARGNRKSSGKLGPCMHRDCCQH